MKQVATAKQLSTVFARNANLDLPERRLLFAVIDLAVIDLKSTSKYDKANKASARRFFRTQHFEAICHAIDLNHEWVRRELTKHAEWV